MDLRRMKKASAGGSVGKPPQPIAEATSTVRVSTTPADECPCERTRGASGGKHRAEGSKAKVSRLKNTLEDIEYAASQVRHEVVDLKVACRDQDDEMLKMARDDETL
ncbi:hypothetical protein BHE74_00008811 [Ensete ventricosum]|nr:hypothetical protein GW17_00004409 [Ensete ventricosum]RWW82711.1 hypothetical protein BHE74_00008811 [Ensete ventricosum]RZR79460.1 hypothetical protein BHM03_00005189 [Ensete ventricosum]